MKSSKRPLAILKKSTIRQIGKFILRVRNIVVNMTNNSTIFTAPSPGLPIVTSDTDDLEAAEAVAATRVAGAAAARNLKYDIVLDDVYGLQRYVQNLADHAADEATAIAIINASGFDLKNHGVRVKPDLAAKYGPLTGMLRLIAKSAGRRVSYEWQKSPDGIAWTDLPATLQAKTTVSGLVAGSRMHFRFRAILTSGATEWCSPIIVIII